MIFIVIIGGIGTLEGPIIGTSVYYGVRELFTNAFALSGSWYLIALGVVAVSAMLIAPRGIWPFIRDQLRIEWLNVSQRLSTVVVASNSGREAK